MSEVRRDIVTDTWVIIDTDETQIPLIPAEIPDGSQPCPFCAGNEKLTPMEIYALRTTGAPDQPGWQVRVVPNIKPILRIEGDLNKSGVGVYDMVTGTGANEVIVETPDHTRNFADLPESQMAKVIAVYRQRIEDLHRDRRFRFILVFKNYGRLSGASTIAHTHTDLIALPATPIRIKMKLKGALEYYGYKERCLFCDIIEQEIEMGDRLIFKTDRFAVIAPYAARFPFEILVIPRRHSYSFKQIEPAEIDDLASVMKRVFQALRSALGDPPYNLVLADSPNLLPRSDYWRTIQNDYHWHIEIAPRLYRTSGFELGTGFYINRFAPERAAAILRSHI